jgi:predicted transcriptional regulator
MAKTKEPPRIGRPPVEIDATQLEALGAMHATYEEIAAFFGCTKRTIIKKLQQPALLLAYENGRHKGRLNLRRLQWKHANGEGSSAVNMTIHMSKQPHWLDEGDRSLVEMNPLEIVITKIERVIIDSPSDSNRQGVPTLIEAQAI